jgi:2-methylaconitate cis-trans-isomerase PrpF/tripartite-type tricarboxylate transporter receptor subunit TctC
MKTRIPCVLMRAGTSRGPFFLREWLPDGDEARDQALIGAIGASDPLQLDGLGGGSTLNSKVAIVSRSSQPDCDIDYLFAQVGVGQRSVDVRPNCGNMLSGVVPFAIEQGLLTAGVETTTARVFNVNTGTRIEVTVRTPSGQVTYDGDAAIDGVAGTAAPVLLNFLDAWGAVTGKLFPTGRRIDVVDGTAMTCIDAAMPLMIVRAQDLGVTGREKPVALDANQALLDRLEVLRLRAGEMMGLGDVRTSVIPKPVLVSDGDEPLSISSRYFTPRKCHSSHAVTGAIGVATAFALPGTVASGTGFGPGRHPLAVLHPAGRIEIEVEIEGAGQEAQVKRASLVRTARKIMQGELHLPNYVFSRNSHDPRLDSATGASLRSTVRLIVPTSAGGANDVIARIIAPKLSVLLGKEVIVDNRAGASGTVASQFVSHAPADGSTIMLGYLGTHAMNPAMQRLNYDPLRDFTPIGVIGASPTLLVVNPRITARDVGELVAQLHRQGNPYSYASAGDGSPPHFAAELFKLATRTSMPGIPHGGAAPAIAATANGVAQIMFPSLFTAQPFINTGALRALAVAGPRRVPAFPDVPTLAELGIGGVEVTQWYALFAPAGAPPDVVNCLSEALASVLAQPEVIARIEAHGASVKRGSPAQLGELVKAELDRWSGVARSLGLAPDDAAARLPEELLET